MLGTVPPPVKPARLPTACATQALMLGHAVNTSL